MKPVYPGSELRATEFGEFLIQAYMGSDAQFSRRFEWGRHMRRAYLDLNRTLHGFGAIPDRQARLADAAYWIEARLRLLGVEPRFTESADAYDEWHLATRIGLQERVGTWTWRGHERTMSHGQAQKWLNMTLKYLYVAGAVGGQELHGIEAGYRHAHLPIDEKVLRKLVEHQCPAADSWRRAGWSRMDAESYMHLQRWVRDNLAGGRSSLDLDFAFWLK